MPGVGRYRDLTPPEPCVVASSWRAVVELVKAAGQVALDSCHTPLTPCTYFGWTCWSS